jgi:hypothetical protein
VCVSLVVGIELVTPAAYLNAVKEVSHFSTYIFDVDHFSTIRAPVVALLL